MTQPKYYEINKEKISVLITKIFIYSLKHAPRQWYKIFGSHIQCLNIMKSEYDPCFFYNKRDEKSKLSICFYMWMI